MQVPFDVVVGEDGVVYMRLIGTLDRSNFDALKAEVEHAKATVKAESERRGALVPVSFDLTDFSGTYNVEAMLAMKGLEEHNRPYVLKTALFGGSTAARVAAELTLALIGQKNLQMFATKDEALAWLSAK
jgi:hypothetical protein